MITVVSALKSEIAPFLERYAVAEKTPLNGGSLYHASREQHFLRTGIGPEQAAKVLSYYLKSYRPYLLINIGFAGSLNPALKAGGLFYINEIRSTVHESSQIPAVPAVDLPGCSLLTVSEAVVSDIKRAELSLRFGAGLVDMEAYELARIAGHHQIPFYCFKMVSDEAGDKAKEQFIKNYRTLANQLFKGIDPVLQTLNMQDLKS